VNAVSNELTGTDKSRIIIALLTLFLAWSSTYLVVLLGVWLADEKVTATGILAMIAILGGVVLVIVGQRLEK
jgi:drug/metabolite transporter (DMT)-like permease